MNLHFKRAMAPELMGTPEAVPTNFLEQIRNGLHGMVDTVHRFTTAGPLPYPGHGKKLHTIRRRTGEQPRYRAGMKLKLILGGRYDKDQEVIGDTVCTGTTRLELGLMTGSVIRWGDYAEAKGYLGLSLIVETERGRLDGITVCRLAESDGLSPEMFLRWFTADVLTRGPGVYDIVHWTNVRY